MLMRDRNGRRRGVRSATIGLVMGALALGAAPAVWAAPVLGSGSAAVPLLTVSRPSPVRIVAYPNCAALQRVHRHGVGKKGAVDRVRGKVTAKGVKTFLVNSALYAKNIKLDRDKDGVACEKK